MAKYNHTKIEKKWQKFWEKNKVFEVQEPSSAKASAGKKKFYGLIEFPYPSGDGLHTGHLRSNTAMDIICRKRRMQGYNVLYPIGFDSFGLPAENYAVQKGVKPQITTQENIKVFKCQLKEAGFGFDWSRSFSTTDPDYYKWTQWIFVQLFKKGLAYKKKENINWCTKCKIGLANEEVVNGVCERCGGEVVKKEKEQWMLKITKYADRLIEDLDKVDYLEQIKSGQINWIGKSEGAEVDFKVKDSNEIMRVFTTRPDTLFGATFMVVAPEHPLVASLLKSKNQNPKIKNIDEIIKYVEKAKSKNDLERGDLNKEKTGVELKGIKAINPVNQKEIPIWIADYVMMSYGTGAIMAVPAHDDRDFELHKKYGIGIRAVVMPKDQEIYRGLNIDKIPEKGTKDYDFIIRTLSASLIEFPTIQDGVNINSDFLDGLETKEAVKKITNWLEKKKLGKKTVNYKLRDWIFSRQRYWGEPIPMINCKKCGWVPVDEKDLPVELPDIDDFMPTDNGDSPLAKLEDWVNVKCPKCKGVAKRETDVMPNWAGSNWYFLRYADPKNDQDFFKVVNRPEIEITKKDEDYFNEFKKIYLDLEDKKVYIWAVNRLLLNGLNNKLWLPLRTVAFMGWEKDKKSIFKYFETNGYKLVHEKKGGCLFEKNNIQVEYVPVHKEKNKIYSYTYKDNIQEMKQEDLPEFEFGNLFGFNYKTVSLEYNLAHYKYIQENENENRKGLKDGDKIKFLEEWVKNVNEKLKYWTPVDWYNGGMEHTTLHLLYSRFIYKFLYDIRAVPKELGPEPYKKRTAHGMILAQGGVKMSKSKKNIINPDDIVEKYGADTVRVYEMFMGPFDQAIAWDDKSVVGVYRFLSRVWQLQNKVNLKNKETRNKKQETKDVNKDLDRLVHQTIKKVSSDIEEMKFNTAVSQMMILVNEMEKSNQLSVISYQGLILLLSPFAPHLCEEIWSSFAKASDDKKYKKSIIYEKWPKFDPKLAKDEEIELVIQVNGKVRDKINVAADITEKEAKKLAVNSEKIKKWLAGKKPKKIIFVPGKLINIVV